MAKKYVKYDEELALKLQEQYGFKDTTLRVWRHRKGIPMRYFQEGGWDPGEPATKRQKDKLKACLELPYFNRAKLGMPPHRVNDFHFSERHVRLTKEEARFLLDKFKDVRKSLELWYQKMNLVEFTNIRENAMIKLSVLIQDRKLYNRLRQRENGIFTDEEVKELRARLDQIFEEFQP